MPHTSTQGVETLRLDGYGALGTSIVSNLKATKQAGQFKEEDHSLRQMNGMAAWWRLHCTLKCRMIKKAKRFTVKMSWCGDK